MIELLPFQKIGSAFLQSKKFALLADDMGLGKTVSSLSYVKLHPEDRPVLMIVTSTTKYQWAKEFPKWGDSNRGDNRYP